MSRSKSVLRRMAGLLNLARARTVKLDSSPIHLTPSSAAPSFPPSSSPSFPPSSSPSSSPFYSPSSSPFYSPSSSPSSYLLLLSPPPIPSIPSPCPIPPSPSPFSLAFSFPLLPILSCLSSYLSITSLLLLLPAPTLFHLCVILDELASALKVEPARLRILELDGYDHCCIVKANLAQDRLNPDRRTLKMLAKQIDDNREKFKKFAILKRLGSFSVMDEN
eukprot:764931-Hanusia_phi.AAC.8